MADDEQSDFSSSDDNKSTPIKKKCPVCKKEIVVKHMKDHIRTHTGARPYKCKDCGKTFIQSSHLKVHSQNIHNATPMTCDHCQKVFQCKKNLINHMKTHLADRKMYHCSVCNKGLASHYAKVEHERIHTGDKPVHCDQCSEKFRTKVHLTTHILNHHRIGAKPHACEICKKGFMNKNNLAIHLRSLHNDDRPLLSCPICSQLFKTKRGFRIHMKERHNSSLRNPSSGSSDDEPVKQTQMKELSIFVRRIGYIERASKGGYKSILIQAKESGRHPVPLK